MFLRSADLKIDFISSLSSSFSVLKWTYVCGNNWGYCEDGTQGVGCGPQEWFRACSDIRITGDPVDHGEDGGGYTSATVFPSDGGAQTAAAPSR